MKKALIAVMVIAATLTTSGSIARADSKWIQLSLWESVQLFSPDTQIKGLRLAIYGRNDLMSGVDIGLAFRTDEMFKGFQWGLIGFGDGGFVGWQATLVNIANGPVKALQGPHTLYNHAGDGGGIQIGLVNINDNYHGLMLGIFNMTDGMNGLQIGLLNIINDKEKWGILPIVNWQF